MKKVIFCLLFLFPYFIVAQHFIIGKVITNKASVPYALIIHNKTAFGVYANESGNFKLEIPEKCIKDSVIVSCVGFETKKIAIAEIYEKSFFEISLKEDTQELSTVIVRPKNTKITRLGSNKNITVPTIGVSCWKDSCSREIQKAIYFPKPTKEGNYYINKVAYYIGGVGVVTTPFRVRIYKYNDQKQQPDEDLLGTSLVVSATDKGWFEVDLQKYNLIMPENGVVVAMEWLLTNEQKYFYMPPFYGKKYKKKMEQENRTHFGQTIGVYEDKKLVSFWFFRLSNKTIWYKQTEFHPMIRLYLEGE